mgnify:CR=1 FL=1|jgi:hypothetical protein|tara:strand:+ start:39 stop:515 length:477 start_codon:yes stop_codon:yes gene_type:complete
MGSGLSVPAPASHYSSDLTKPVNGDDFRAIDNDKLKLTMAKAEALRYRQEMFRLVTQQQQQETTGERKEQGNAASPASLFYNGKPSIDDLCPLNTTDDVIFENCIHYISHIRKLLHMQVQRRRRLSRRGRQLLHIASGDLADDSSDDSDGGELDRAET